MIKENRLMVRLIALWMVFILSLGLAFWSGQQLIVSVVKMANGGYQATPTNPMMGGMGYGGPGFTGCLIPPMYPQPAPMGTDMKVDPALMAKYGKDMEKYNSDYMAACKADVERQQKSQSNQEKSTSTSDITVHSILALLGAASAIISMMAIKKAEETV